MKRICLFKIIVIILIQILLISNQSSALAPQSDLNLSLTNLSLCEKPFFDAVKAQRIEMVEKCLVIGVDVNLQDELGNTAMHYAVLQGNTTMMNLLFTYGARIIVLNKDEKTAEDFAKEKGQKEALELIKEIKQLFNLILNFKGEKVKLEEIKVLLKKGLPVNFRNKNGRTILFIALRNAESGQHNFDLVNLILKYGADPDLADKDNKSPMDLCEENSARWKELDQMRLDRFRKIYYKYIEKKDKEPGYVKLQRLFEKYIQDVLEKNLEFQELIKKILRDKNYPASRQFELKDYELLWKGFSEAEALYQKRAIQPSGSRKGSRPFVRVPYFDDDKTKFFYSSKDFKKQISLKTKEVHDQLRKENKDVSGSANHAFLNIGLVISEEPHYRSEYDPDVIEANYLDSKMQKKRADVRRKYINAYLGWNIKEEKFVLIDSVDISGKLDKDIRLVDFVAGGSRFGTDRLESICWKDIYKRIKGFPYDEIAKDSPSSSGKDHQISSHSERWIEIVLKQNPQLFVDLIGKEKKQGLKIYAMILDFSSTKDVCTDCQLIFKGMRKDYRAVLNNAEEKLKKAGYVISEYGLRLLPRVTSLTSFKGGGSGHVDDAQFLDLKTLHGLNLFAENPFWNLGTPKPEAARKLVFAPAHLGPTKREFVGQNVVKEISDPELYEIINMEGIETKKQILPIDTMMKVGLSAQGNIVVTVDEDYEKFYKSKSENLTEINEAVYETLLREEIKGGFLLKHHFTSKDFNIRQFETEKEFASLAGKNAQNVRDIGIYMHAWIDYIQSQIQEELTGESLECQFRQLKMFRQKADMYATIATALGQRVMPSFNWEELPSKSFAMNGYRDIFDIVSQANDVLVSQA